MDGIKTKELGESEELRTHDKDGGRRLSKIKAHYHLVIIFEMLRKFNSSSGQPSMRRESFCPEEEPKGIQMKRT